MHHELQTDNLFDSFSGVWKRVTTEPRRFFEEMPVTGGLQAPLLFLVICLANRGGRVPADRARGFAFWIIVLGLVRAFVGAFVLMVIARQIFHGTGDYEATFRALAYASAPVVLLWIPLIHPLVVLYLLFLIIIGLERVQGFDATKAVLTMLLAVVTVGAIMWTLGLGHMVLPPGPFMTHCP